MMDGRRWTDGANGQTGDVEDWTNPDWYLDYNYTHVMSISEETVNREWEHPAQLSYLT